MYMYNTLNIAINPETLHLKLQCEHIFLELGMFKNYMQTIWLHHTQK